MAERTRVAKIEQVLWQAEVLLGQGRTVAEACGELGISAKAVYRWEKEVGTLTLGQVSGFASLRTRTPGSRNGSPI